MKQFIRYLYAGLVLLGSGLLSCSMNLFDDPSDPELSAISLRLQSGDSHPVAPGTTEMVECIVTFPHYFKNVSVTSVCCDIDTVLSVDPDKTVDTILLGITFPISGVCTVTATGEMNSSTGSTRIAFLDVDVGSEELNTDFAFTIAPDSLITTTRKEDTLIFIAGNTNRHSPPVTYSYSVVPTIGKQYFSLESTSSNDTVRIISKHPAEGTYTITLTASIRLGYSTYTVGATVPVTVFNLIPSYIDMPVQIIQGTADTLSLVIDNSEHSESPAITLLNRETLDPDKFSIIPTDNTYSSS